MKSTKSTYARAFRQQWDFIQRHLIDAQYGGWLPETKRDGSPSGDGAKAHQWKANYHTSRALMNVATRLRELGPGRAP